MGLSSSMNNKDFAKRILLFLYKFSYISFYTYFMIIFLKLYHNFFNLVLYFLFAPFSPLFFEIFALKLDLMFLTTLLKLSD